jgi:hypothetical protein
MSPNLPGDLDSYSVWVFPNRSSLGAAVIGNVSRRYLEEWAIGTKAQFNLKLLAFLQQARPNQPIKVDLDRLREMVCYPHGLPYRAGDIVDIWRD